MQTSKKNAVYFVSLGCPKNLVDSEVMLGLLEKDRYFAVKDPQQATVIVVNTCSFIQSAKEESIQHLFEMAQLKHTGQCRVLVAAGCFVQRYSDILKKQMPEIDLFIGTGEYHRISELLSQQDTLIRNSQNLLEKVYVQQPAFIHTEKDPRSHTGSRASGYLKISEGCNRRCSFCIIPSLRGHVRSRSIASLVSEAQQMVQQGVVELNLVAQDLTEYGMEGRYQERLETLLPALCQVEGLKWIRLHYVYPDIFSDELIDIIAKEKKIVKYLDMPIQHTQDQILEKMNRRLKKERLFSLVQRIREKMPEIVLRTSIIVGFPGETEEDFETLCEDLKFLDLDYVGVFTYSKEEGTPAARLSQQVHASTKKRRLKTLTCLLQERAHEKLKLKLGRRETVLIEGLDDTKMLIQGRLSTQAQEIDGRVFINDLVSELDFQQVKAGCWVEAELTQVLSYDFLAKGIRLLSHAS